MFCPGVNPVFVRFASLQKLQNCSILWGNYTHKIHHLTPNSTLNLYCTHTHIHRTVVECRAVCVCVFVFPAIVRRRLIPPLFTDRRLSKLPELIIKSNNINSQTLSASLSVCLSVLYLPAHLPVVCLFIYTKPSHICGFVYFSHIYRHRFKSGTAGSH